MVKTLIVIAGPTAIGKTQLAIKLAHYYRTEIISADSRQFYQEMEIGTAKPSPEELRAVKHYFINSHSVFENFSVGDFERETLILIDNIFKKKHVIILVGGSGLFINAIVDGFDDLPTASKQIRDNFNKLYEKNGIGYLQSKLKIADPKYFSEVDINNPQRLIRALEVCETTGQPFSNFRNHKKKIRPFRIIKIGLKTDRESMYKNINQRVDLMVEKGLVAEAEGLMELRKLNPLNTVGYSELFSYLEGQRTLSEAIEKIKQNTRRFAKRQMTWFNKSDDLVWFDPQDYLEIVTYLDSQLSHPEREEQKN